eukprot:2888247-Pleurochrysis_carterae.AAC.1
MKIHKIQSAIRGWKLARARGGWGAPARWLEEGRSQGSGSHRGHGVPRAEGAKRERSASTHAAQV